jgi:uncharacterized protein YdeI (YjbR/CyaY-like superfamily)
MSPSSKSELLLAARYFASPDELRRWLAEHHDTATEVLVGFWKKGTGHATMTWPESVAEALCFGWIDGVRRSVDEERYTIRFTPRKATSIWSAVNIRKMEELIAACRATPPGIAAFARRDAKRSRIYAYEQATVAKLDASDARRFRAHDKAWRWFEAQAPSYHQRAIHWVTSAKKPETRSTRLEQLIALSHEGRRR